MLTNVGAYSIVKAHMFNGINLPSIYSVDAGGRSDACAGNLLTKILSLDSEPALMRLYEHEWDLPWPSAPRDALRPLRRMVGERLGRRRNPRSVRRLLE